MRRRASPRKPSPLGMALRPCRVGRSSDSRTRVWRPAYLPSLPGRCEPVRSQGVRFRLPLRGSSGFAPDSLLSPTDDRVWPGTDRDNISGRSGWVNPTTCGQVLQRVLIQLARADADHLLQRAHEDLALADLAGAGGVLD